LGETFERLDQLSKHQGTYRGIATGFKQLDNMLSGLQRSDLIILAARPSVGKSSLALDIARHVAIFENLPVGLFSLEMSKDQIADRLIASHANIDLWKLRTGKLQDGAGDNDFSRIQSAMGSLSEAGSSVHSSARKRWRGDEEIPGNRTEETILTEETRSLCYEQFLWPNMKSYFCLKTLLRFITF
jgi:replicative DNA helicase